MADAEEDIKSSSYTVAIDKLRSIRNRFPYSSVAVEAQLRIADVYFLQDSFIEAAGAYETFRDLHPKHAKASYAMFRVGKSYLNDAPTDVARDQVSSRRALEAYGEFLNRFPQAVEAEEARKDVSVIRERLAGKELYIGEFYRKRSFPKSAKPRFEKVVQLYPETEAAKVATQKLQELRSLGSLE